MAQLRRLIPHLVVMVLVPLAHLELSAAHAAAQSTQDLRGAVCAVVDSASLVAREGRWYPSYVGSDSTIALRGCHGSGLLLTPYSVVTVSDVASPSSPLALVFDFRDDIAAPKFFRQDQVRIVRSIVNCGDDLVLLLFDDELKNRPTPANCDYFVTDQDSVLAIGHVLGRRMKSWSPAAVVCASVDCPQEFTSSLLMDADASGAPVFLSRGYLAGRAVAIHHRSSSPFAPMSCVCRVSVTQSHAARLSVLSTNH